MVQQPTPRKNEAPILLDKTDLLSNITYDLTFADFIPHHDRQCIRHCDIV